MTEETRLRFLTAIARQIPVERIAEVHLFPAIRQGGMESGVAVIAVESDVPVHEISLDVDGGYVPESAVADAAVIESHAELKIDEQLADESAYVTDETMESAPHADSRGDDTVADDEADVRDVVITAHDEEVVNDGDSAADELEPGDPATLDQATADADVDAEPELASDELATAIAADPDAALAVDFEEVAAPAAPLPRYIVYSARYRLVLKGIDRGKWEVSVTAEADAPLLTVDAVVRGVQRRSGDADETIRLSGEEVRATLPAPQPG